MEGRDKIDHCLHEIGALTLAPSDAIVIMNHLVSRNRHFLRLTQVKEFDKWIKGNVLDLNGKENHWTV